MAFQPTLPHRERRCLLSGDGGNGTDFNPRSRTGSDAVPWPCPWCPKKFQPTLPHRERPVDSGAGTAIYDFNPRSRTGSDGLSRREMEQLWPFQPTLPHRERPARVLGAVTALLFQPTLPHRERPWKPALWRETATISTHAPAQGATKATGVPGPTKRDFNPRSRTGSDISENLLDRWVEHFNPRSRTGSDLPMISVFGAGVDFNPRSRTGSDSPGKN